MIVRLLLSACAALSIVASGSANQCEEKGCPDTKQRNVNVHVIPHSHNDAGWLESVDEVYAKHVKDIYGSSIDSLVTNNKRRYVSCENVFFSRWWKERSQKEQDDLRALLSSGRLQFVGGGWVQNDEAVTHYTAIIDQMTLGLRFLNDTFGDCGRPTVAWQADPFGHSRCQANLFAQMGFDGLMIGRVSNDDVARRQAEKEMLFVWKTEPGNKRIADMFTWIPPNTYYVPQEFCFDQILCPSTESEVTQRLESAPRQLVDYLTKQTEVYPSSQLAFIYGGDLSFHDATETFAFLDVLLQNTTEVGQAFKINLDYSTPGCYVKALHGLNKTWPTFRGDFLPYTDKPSRTWTGFYTTRPAFKYMVRYANGFLQACKQLAVGGDKEQLSRLQVLKEAVATLQHHDGITGTSKELVVLDYVQSLWRGIQECEAVIRGTFALMMDANQFAFTPERFRFCHLLNISECEFTERNSKFVIVVYNPLSRPENVIVRFPVTSKDVKVTDHTGKKVKAQVAELLEHRTRIPERKSNATLELVTVVPVPALGFSAFNIAVATKQPLPKSYRRQHLREIPPAMNPYLELEKQERFIENDRYRLEVDTTSGLLSRLYLRNRNTVISFSQTFQSYVATASGAGAVSGHYIFSASESPEDLSSRVTYRIIKGPVVEEIHQIYNPYVSQVIRLYRNSETIEFQWTVGPIGTATGSDIITLFQTDIDNSGEFYTDGNGKQNMKRRLEVSPNALPVSSNYYPVVSWIYIQDALTGLQLSVIPDRPQGGSSLSKGAIELMVHRRHHTADSLGNPEDLDETGSDGDGLIVTGKHRVFFGTTKESWPRVRLEALRSVYLPVTIFVAPYLLGNMRLTRRTMLQDRLPATLHVLTLEPISKNTILFRIEHVGLVNKTIRFSLQNLFKHVRMENIQPTLLGGNRYLEGFKRFSWNTQKEAEGTTEETRRSGGGSKDEVTLSPGDITTFVAQLKPID